MRNSFLLVFDYALWKLYTGSVCLLLLVIYCWWSFGYKPLQCTIDNYMSQLKQLKDPTNSYITVKKRCYLLTAELKKQQKLAKKLKDAEQDKQPHQIISWIITCLANNKLSLQQYAPAKQSHDACSFSFVGRFDQLIKFFETLETKVASFNCQKCVIKKIDELLVSCQLTLIF